MWKSLVAVTSVVLFGASFEGGDRLALTTALDIRFVSVGGCFETELIYREVSTHFDSRMQPVYKYFELISPWRQEKERQVMPWRARSSILKREDAIELIGILTTRIAPLPADIVDSDRTTDGRFLTFQSSWQHGASKGQKAIRVTFFDEYLAPGEKDAYQYSVKALLTRLEQASAGGVEQPVDRHQVIEKLYEIYSLRDDSGYRMSLLEMMVRFGADTSFVRFSPNPKLREHHLQVLTKHHVCRRLGEGIAGLSDESAEVQAAAIGFIESCKANQ